MTARPAARALALEAALAGVAGALWSAGPAAPAPPLRSWSGAAQWYASVGPDVAVASVVRIGALVVTVWLMVATAAQLVAGAGASTGVRRAADLIAPRSLKRLVHGLAGFSLSAGLAVVAPSAGTPTVEPASVAVLHLRAEPPPGTAALHLVPDAIAPDVAPPAMPVPVAPVADTVIVEPGDSLWSIAEEVLAGERDGAQPDDATAAQYWRRLVDANRANLVDPANPDLIFPGQVVTLPAP